MANRYSAAPWVSVACLQCSRGVEDVERLHKKTDIEMKFQELVGKAVVNGKLTKAQASSLLRHRKHHTEGHMLFMMKLMIEKHMTFSAAHEAAMKQVGK